ncbi:hypothetical protein IGI04_003319, partial [Brassica rapa subsp. trilocularis]
KRSPAENPRRLEALAVDSFSLSRAVSLLFLSLRRVSFLSLSLLAAPPSLSLPAASLSPRCEQPRVVVVAAWCHRSQIPFLLPPILRSRSRTRLSTREGWDKSPKKGGIKYPGKGGKKRNAAAGKNRGAGKIESRRVLAGRGRNTLQRRSEPEELGGGPTRAGDFTGSSKKRGGMVRLSCVAVRLHRLCVVTRRFSFRIEPTISGNVNGKEGNATETHGTRNGTHGDVGKIDMCVLNPVPWNPGRKWEGAGVSIANVEGEFEQLRVSGRDQVNKKSSYCGVVEFQRGNGKPDIRAGGKRLADDTAPHRAGEAGEGMTDARPRRAQLHGGIKPCKEMDFWHSDITVKLVPRKKKKKGNMGAGPTIRAWARRRGRSNPGWPRDGRTSSGRKPISDCENQTKDLLGVKRMMEDHLGVKRTMEDHLGVKRDDGESSWSRMQNGHLGAKRDDKNHTGILMSSPVHHELGERHMRYGRYGPKGTRAYARKPYRDAWGDVVPALFPDEEEMEFAEPPNAPIQETTVSRRILMPHFQRAAEYRRLYQGQGTFQFAPEVDTTPPTRGRGRPRKTGPTRAGPGPTRMEDSVPTRKRGRPRKIPSIDAGSLRSITRMCRCGTLTQARQGPRSVREYTEEFLESAKRCKPKTAEDWCRWYKAGLREEIQGRLIGVLEPLEFALVNRMAGQAMEAERTLTRRVVAISSSEEDVEVEEDPSEDSDWEEEPASPTGSGRVAGPKPDGEQKSPLFFSCYRGIHGFWRYLETYLFIPVGCHFVLPLFVFGNSPRFWDVKFELKIWNSGRIPNKRGRIQASTSFSLIRNLEAKPCRESPETGIPSRRLLLSLPRRLSPLSLSSPCLFSLSLSSPRLLLSLSRPRLSLLAVSSREWWWWPRGVIDLRSRWNKVPGKGWKEKKCGGRSVQKRRRCGAIASDKNGRVRIEAPVRLSHAESWREGVVIHCKGGPNPRNWAAGLPGQATSQEAARKGEEWSA